MEQTADGVLWLGSRQGLYRFDGKAFSRVSVVDEGPSSPADIYALKALPNGDLWIGQFVGGAMRLHGQAVTRFHSGLPRAGVTQFNQDRSGQLWASTTAGLARFDGKEFHSVGPESGLPTGMSVTAALDGRGNLLVRTYLPGLFVLRPGARTFARVNDGLQGYLPFSVDRNGVAWESAKDHLYRIDPETFQAKPIMGLNYGAFAPDIRTDPAGGFWATERGFGVRHISLSGVGDDATPVGTDPFREVDGLTSDQAMSNFVDRDGDLWVGTERGLDRFHAGAITRIDVSIHKAYLGVQTANDGRVWIAAFMGGAWLQRPDDTLQAQTTLPKSITKITSITADGQGDLWIAHGSGIGRLSEKEWRPLPLLPEMTGKAVTAMTMASGQLWAAVDRLGIACWDGHDWRLVSGTSALAVTSMRSSGNDLYVGTRDGRLLRQSSAGPVSEIARPSLGALTVLTAQGHILWVGGDKGLGMWNGAAFRVLPTRSNPSIYRVSGLLFASNGDLWMNTAVGIVRTPASMIGKVLGRSGEALQLQVYDAADGVEGNPLRSFLTPTAAATRDGKLVFTTQLGVYQVDPAGLPARSLSPRPNISALRADGEGLPLGNPRLRPRPHTLEIDYGAASLRDAQRLTYRYRLTGYDRDWQLAGTRNAALYTDLPPGNYSFQSQSSYDGVNWSASSEDYSLRVPAAFSQRFSVKVAAALLLMTALWALLRWRFQRAYQLAQLRLQERLQERERIARDLHDTLLQGVQGLILRFGAIADSSMYDDVQRDNMQRALQLADRVVAEGRDRVRDLRKQSGDANQLEECLAEAGTILALSSRSRFQRRTLGTKKPLHPLITDELCMIGREALQNAFQHADANTIEVRLDYSAKELSMSVQDDGAGLSNFTEAATLAAHKGHWGLKGMRERAERIGAQFHIESRPGKGCMVQVNIAASLAYTNYVPIFDVPWLSKLTAAWQRRYLL